MHLLDNPIWFALNTRQVHFAQVDQHARRFPPDVTSLAGMTEETPDAYGSLARLLNGVPAGLFLRRAPDLPAGWSLLRELPLLQMVFENGHVRAQKHELVVLTPDDALEMLALAELTKPGPFGKRTHEMGTYIGVKVEGRLVAMAGERLRVPRFTEISAVCTHPDHVGHGYATSLIADLVERILARGETPFLHVAGENRRAIALYEHLGFRQRYRFQLAVVRNEGEFAAAV